LAHGFVNFSLWFHSPMLLNRTSWRVWQTKLLTSWQPGSRERERERERERGPRQDTAPKDQPPRHLLPLVKPT
jgi:hypothetical protein